MPEHRQKAATPASGGSEAPPPLRNTPLGVVLERRLGESVDDAAERIARETFYASRERFHNDERISSDITQALVAFFTLEGRYHA